MSGFREEYEVYLKPAKPEGVQGKRIFITGGGLAGLAAALFLLRDCSVDGEQITILEKELLSGGACDGYSFEGAGHIMRGDHKLEGGSPLLADLMRSIPSADADGSLLEEMCELDRFDPNYSLCRATAKRGESASLGDGFRLPDSGCVEILKLLLSTDEELAEKRVSDVLGEDVLSSPFWLYFRTTFAFRENYSALELKTAISRRLKHLSGLPDLSAFSYTRYNLFDSLILPLTRKLQSLGVAFRYGVHVTDVAFDCARGRKRATRIDYVEQGEEGCIDLDEQDIALITLGSCVENSARGSLTEPAPFLKEIREGGSFDLWRKIALQDPSFGHPEVFSLRPEETALVSATITTGDRKIISHIKKICKRDPFAGKTVTGGIVTVTDSPWLMNWSVARQPLFRGQEEGQCVIWLYGLRVDQNGEYVEKPMRECTGAEICAEWLYHIGVPADQIEELAGEHTQTIPVIMPFAGAPLLPRQPGDRPDPLPEGAENFAFLGQFTENGTDAAFSAEYAVLSAMQAVYTLFGIERHVPDMTEGVYDLRTMMRAASVLRDGKSLRDTELKRSHKTLLKSALKIIKGTEIEQLMREEHLL